MKFRLFMLVVLLACQPVAVVAAGLDKVPAESTMADHCPGCDEHCHGCGAGEGAAPCGMPDCTGCSILHAQPAASIPTLELSPAPRSGVPAALSGCPPAGVVTRLIRPPIS